MTKIERLKELIISEFKQCDEILKIYSFGSIATNNFDKYSDIDLKIITSNIEVSTKRLETTLERVSKILYTFPLIQTNSECAYMVFWQNQSPFHKLDIGLGLNDTSFENFTCEYQKISKQEIQNTLPQIVSELEWEHECMDCLIGSTRYLKYRLRKYDFAAFKFYRAFIEQYLKILLKSKRNLLLEDFMHFDRTDNNEAEILYPGSPDEMDQLYNMYIRKYSNLIPNKVKLRRKNFLNKVLELWDEYIH